MVSTKEKSLTVDEYLSKLPIDVRTTLEKLRQTIRSVVPAAEEVISYGMPGYRYCGMLVYFAAFKNHCSFFPGSSTISKIEETKSYQTSKGTLQFTIDKPIPTTLVKKIVKLRKEENEAKYNAKLLKKNSGVKKLARKKTAK